MRILITIPHYFRPTGGQAADGREHGSLATTPQPRTAALAACLNALHQLDPARRCVLDHEGKQAKRIEAAAAVELDVVICTTKGCHLLRTLPPIAGRWSHLETSAEPILLGFECQAVLRSRLGEYDYYGYLEDDLILTDPWFFSKLAWFNSNAGDDRLLQPNRMEVGPHPVIQKVYLDGPLALRCSAHLQDVTIDPEIVLPALGRDIRFVRTTNPHSGCFFLSAAQMTRWAQQPYFLDRDTGFIGPLESAATLGITRTFKVYKPDLANGDFLEIQHHGHAYLSMIQSAGP